ncbi:hypothetical protein FQR65_LT20074 [Abscondita terminalis]|nr:hypothetical protein FQR65_LT20074 [Abscondita terminalis]
MLARPCLAPEIRMPEIACSKPHVPESTPVYAHCAIGFRADTWLEAKPRRVQAFSGSGGSARSDDARNAPDPEAPHSAILSCSCPKKPRTDEPVLRKQQIFRATCAHRARTDHIRPGSLARERSRGASPCSPRNWAQQTVFMLPATSCRNPDTTGFIRVGDARSGNQRAPARIPASNHGSNGLLPQGTDTGTGRLTESWSPSRERQPADAGPARLWDTASIIGGSKPLGVFKLFKRNRAPRAAGKPPLPPVAVDGHVELIVIAFCRCLSAPFPRGTIFARARTNRVNLRGADPHPEKSAVSPVGVSCEPWAHHRSHRFKAITVLGTGAVAQAFAHSAGARPPGSRLSAVTNNSAQRVLHLKPGV